MEKKGLKLFFGLCSWRKAIFCSVIKGFEEKISKADDAKKKRRNEKKNCKKIIHPVAGNKKEMIPDFKFDLWACPTVDKNYTTTTLLFPLFLKNLEDK